MPIPAIPSAASATSTRNWPIRSTKRSSPGDALSRVFTWKPELAKRALNASASAAASACSGRRTRYFQRAIEPIWTRPEAFSAASLTITVGPSAKPSERRSGSPAITPPIRSSAWPMRR